MMSAATSRGGPWGAEDLLRTTGTVVIGVVASAAAWYLASGEDQLAPQLRWASLSVTGFMVGSYGLLVWVLRGRRAIGERRRALLGEPAPRTGASTPAAASLELVGGAGRGRYHRQDCPMAMGRGWRVTSRSAHERAGRAPCGVCRP